MDATKVVKYISEVEPKLEKFASEKNKFITKLQEKVSYAVKIGSINTDKANRMLKEAMEDPSSALSYLDIPNTYTHKIGTPVNKTTTKNVLYDFVMG
jgi:DNA-directed RNA polymerase subunit F